MVITMRKESAKRIGRKVMSRIDVVPADKGRFRVLVNFIARGIEYSNAQHANSEAQKFHTDNPQYELHLAKAE